MSVATAGEILRLNFKQAAQVAKTNRRLAQETTAEVLPEQAGLRYAKNSESRPQAEPAEFKNQPNKKAEPANKYKKENYEFFTLQPSGYK